MKVFEFDDMILLKFLHIIIFKKEIFFGKTATERGNKDIFYHAHSLRAHTSQGKGSPKPGAGSSHLDGRDPSIWSIGSWLYCRNQDQEQSSRDLNNLDWDAGTPSSSSSCCVTVPTLPYCPFLCPWNLRSCQFSLSSYRLPVPSLWFCCSRESTRLLSESLTFGPVIFFLFQFCFTDLCFNFSDFYSFPDFDLVFSCLPGSVR